MKHTLKIKVSKEPADGGVVSCRTISMREKVLSKLFLSFFVRRGSFFPVGSKEEKNYTSPD